MKSITCIQRQDYYTREEFEASKAKNRYAVINPNPQNFAFSKHMTTWNHCENNITERLVKSTKISQVFQPKSGCMDTYSKSAKIHSNGNSSRKSGMSKRIIKHIRACKQPIFSDSQIEIVPKEENYLLNEIIEHILNSKHQSRVEWNRIRCMPKGHRNYSRDLPRTHSDFNSNPKSLMRSKSFAKGLRIQENQYITVETSKYNSIMGEKGKVNLQTNRSVTR